MKRILDEHKCKAVVEKGQDIRYITGMEGGFTKAAKRGSWFVSHSECYASAIDFCPWCGEELGLPEKQIWVDRKKLVGWRETAHMIRRDLRDTCQGAPRARAEALANGIGWVLDE